MLALLQKRRARQAVSKRNPASLASAQQKVLVTAPVPEGALVAKSWEEITHQLQQDVARVRTLAGSEERVPYKKELVKKYQAVVENLLQTHENLHGLEVVWWWYQWQLDCGLLPQVHDAFRDAVMRGLETPHKWSSNGQTAFCQEVFNYSHNAHSQGVKFDSRFLFEAVQGLEAGDFAINAPLKVKILRLAGDLHDAQGNKRQALELFKWVMKIDPNKGGRKGRLKQLKEELNHDSNQES